jgi:hypothetical protein
MAKKAHVKSCAHSERTSCSTAHGPITGGDGGRGSGEVPA